MNPLINRGRVLRRRGVLSAEVVTAEQLLPVSHDSTGHCPALCHPTGIAAPAEGTRAAVLGVLVRWWHRGALCLSVPVLPSLPHPTQGCFSRVTRRAGAKCV